MTPPVIKSILLVDDENLFHLVFEDVCFNLDISLNLEAIDSADEADRLFDKNDQVQFNFLGSIPVTYHNPQRVDTWEEAPKKITIHLTNDEHVDFDSPNVHAPYAEMVRTRAVKSVEAYL